MLLPTSMNSVNLKSVKTVMIMIEGVGMLLRRMLMLRMTRTSVYENKYDGRFQLTTAKGSRFLIHWD